MRHHNRQRGFTLPEALISAAIAAGVIASASTSLSASLKAQSTANAAENSLIEAQNLSARLKSSMPLDDIIEAYPQWTFTQVLIETPEERVRNKYSLLKISVSKKDDPNLHFSTIRIIEVERP